MPLTWLFRRGQRRRGSTARRRTHAAPLAVRRLERRRVLNATIQSLAVPSMAAEGETVTATATGTGFGTLFFDWTVKQGSDTIATGSGTSLDFVAPDDGIYDVTLQLFDSAQSVDSETRTLTVTNVSPVLAVADDRMINEGQLLDLSGLGAPLLGVYIDDGMLDMHTATIDWGDDSLPEPAQIFPGNGSGALGGMHTYADNGDYTVVVTISDGDGGSDTEDFLVTVKNVNPVAVFANNGPVNEASPADVNFTSPFDPSSADTMAGFRYAFDFNNDGTFEVGGDTYAASTSDASQTVPGSFLDDGPGSYTIRGRIYDKDGGFTDHTTQIVVTNVAPTAILSNSGPINEGLPASVSFSAQFDPSQADTAAEFRYAYDFDNNGTFDLGDGSYGGSVAMSSADVPANLIAEGPGTRTVLARIIDKNGDHTDYLTDIAIVNVAPQLQMIVGDMIDEGDDASIFMTIVDPSPVDVFEVDVDWQDGTSDTISGLGAADANGVAANGTTFVWTAATRRLELQHRYLDDGPNPGNGIPTNTYVVDLTVRDDDLGTGGPYTAEVVVNNVRPVLAVADDRMVNEGQVLDLSGLGAPLLGVFIDDGVVDTHTATVDWGDGSGSEPADVIGVGSGALGGKHIYADDGMYTVTVTITDDDGGFDTQEFVVTVKNVVPTLSVVGTQTVDEGSLLSITDLGTITDPGFNNPDNPNAQPGGSLETFTFWIDWNDGAEPDTGIATIDDVGGEMDLTNASFDGEHKFADNGDYDVIVRVADDNMSGNFTDGVAGVDFVEMTFTVMVDNVAPTLAEISDRSTDEGSLLQIQNLGVITDPGFNNPDRPVGASFETFTFWIDWDDGKLPDTGSAMIDDVRGMMDLTDASFDGSHTYADNGIYTVKVRVADDDMSGDFVGGDPGIDFVEQTFTVVVDNEIPFLTGVSNLEVDEGQSFVLSGDAAAGTLNLGVGLADPGFDNMDNAGNLSNGGEFEETFSSMTVNWGDGSLPEVIGIENRISGSPGVLTTAEFSDLVHTYADNGDYIVTVIFQDDDVEAGDGQPVMGMFTITVNNVAPTVTPIADQEFDESETFVLPNIGTFTDPGFNNPDRPGGASFETFTFSIDWGDGTTNDGGPATVDVLGAIGVPTAGSFDGSHTYADNGTYTVRLLVADDDMLGNFADGMPGEDTFTEVTFTIVVNNIAPQFEPFDGVPFQPGEKMFEGDDLTATGLTRVRVAFSDPGFDNSANAGNPSNGGETAETFTYTVDWGDGTVDVVDVVFVAPGTPLVVNTQTTMLASVRNPGDATTLTTGSFEVQHRYLGPPNPQNPTAPITITLTVMDDDGGMVTDSIEVRNPGIDTTNVAIDTTPDVPRLELSPPVTTAVFIDSQTSSTQSLQTPEVRVARGEVTASSERYLELRVVHPDGLKTKGIPLKDEELFDLRGLFAKLPDGRYQIFLIRTENNSERLVIEVDVRNGRVIEPTDDSEGTRDRPPTSEDVRAIEIVPMEVTPPNQTPPEAPEDATEQPAGEAASATDHADYTASSAENESALINDAERALRPPFRSLHWSVPLAGLGLAARGGWSKRVDEALAQADERSWQRLRRAARLGRNFKRPQKTPDPHSSTTP